MIHVSPPVRRTLGSGDGLALGLVQRVSAAQKFLQATGGRTVLLCILCHVIFCTQSLGSFLVRILCMPYDNVVRVPW